MSESSVYAEPGTSLQQMGGECPPGWIEMPAERPSGEFIASAAGEWVEEGFAAPCLVSRYQMREALRLTRFSNEGSPGWTLFDAFEELLTDSTTPPYYRRAWEELLSFDSGGAVFTAAADVLGLTQQRRDDVFRLAASLKA